MAIIENIWTFETPNFRVRVDAVPEYDSYRDVYGDDQTTDEVEEKLESGEWIIFGARASVYSKELGTELGTGYIGMNVHPSVDDFRDHVGIAKLYRQRSEELGREVRVGSYFSDIVREAIDEARRRADELRRKGDAAWRQLHT